MFRKVNAFGRMIDCSCCVHDDVSKTGATVGLSTDVFIVLKAYKAVRIAFLFIIKSCQYSMCYTNCSWNFSYHT